MNCTKSKAYKMFGVAALAFVVLCSAFVLIDGDSDALTIDGKNYTPTEIVLSPGATWSYTAQFPADLIAGTELKIDETYSTSGIGTYATVTGHTVDVGFPIGTAIGTYTLVLKATHAESGQTTYQVIDFKLVAGLVNSTAAVNDIIKGTEMSFAVQVTASSEIAAPTFVWEEVEGVTGMTFNAGTHTYTGTPATIGTHTLKVKVICDQTKESIVISIPFTVYSKLDATASAETIKTTDGSQKSSTQVTIPSDLTVKWAVTTGTLPTGFTIDENTGVVTGSSLKYNDVTVTLTGTTQKKGTEPVQTITKQLTIQTENVLSITKGSDILTYKNNGTAKTSTTTISSELSSVTWNVTGCDGATISTAGVVSVVNPATAGMGQTLTITATTEFGQSKTTTITLDVEDTLQIGAMKFDGSEITKAVTFVGSSKTVSFDITGGSGNTLAVSDKGGFDINKIDESTVTLTGNATLAAGSFTITITSAAGQTDSATYNAQVFSAIEFKNAPEADAVFYPDE